MPPGARPLVMLAAAAPLNPDGIDVILALPAVCDAYASLQSPHQCDQARLFVIDNLQYVNVWRAFDGRVGRGRGWEGCKEW